MSPGEHEPRVRVAGIIIEDSRMLLITHKKDGAEYWLVPGGGVDYGESLEESLKREFLEELNIDVSVEELAFLSDSIDPEGGRHIINIFFFCRYLSGDYKLGSDMRLSGYEFFSADDISNLQIYPPINEKLSSLITDRGQVEYLGKLWQKA